MSDKTWHKVADLDELAENECKMANAGNKPVAIARTGDGYHALDNKCLHLGGPLGQGSVEEGHIICPWHGRAYNLRTGECMNVEERINVHKIEVRDDGIFVLTND